ncbi:hypothetical protein [Fluviicola sp.]|jgi:hypothetical protein|uniref:hypothetical protein n=1 Tax=Fluviicola sp. TaxID=1917219 RepID=UPI00281EE7CA|nr:hypothetical protein [Fluviicola sp.]MDR0803383.1 hypothetical protein [Fluviicola sp.]
MRQLLLSILFLATVGASVAQTKGQISYSMDFSSDNPDMAMALPMMQGSTMELCFMPEKSKVDLVMGTFMKMSTVIDVKADQGLMLMEMMGNKTATELKKISTAKPAEDQAGPKVETTSETKDIIGFKCTKTIVRDTDGGEIIIWVAKDLKAALQGQQQFTAKGIDGTPLEFSTEKNGMKIHFIATKFTGNVDKKIFSLKIPEGYTVMTEEELKNLGM